jgi:RNA polymerase sigma-70 factor, ECF subfamily
MASATATRTDQSLLDAARAGDEDAFTRLLEPHRAELRAHCYRMLGSLHDAEDALQEAMLRAWRGLPGFDGRSALGTWLYRIATNVCLDVIRRRPKRVLPVDYGPQTDPEDVGEPLPGSRWVGPYPDEWLGLEDGRAAPDARYEQREAVELAFVAALQHLPPRQRAVLILRDVLGFSAKETAVILDTTVASINSAMQRARRTFEKHLPERSEQAALRALGDARARDLLGRLIDAFERDDVGAILALLADDASFEMPPYTGWCRCRDAIADSWFMPSGPVPRLRHVPTRLNGQLALGVYARNTEAGAYLPVCLDVFAVDDGKISRIVAFRSLDQFSLVGLPDRLPLGEA